MAEFSDENFTLKRGSWISCLIPKVGNLTISLAKVRIAEHPLPSGARKLNWENLCSLIYGLNPQAHLPTWICFSEYGLKTQLDFEADSKTVISEDGPFITHLYEELLCINSFHLQ